MRDDNSKRLFDTLQKLRDDGQSVNAIRVEVCHGLPDRQWLVTVDLPAGSVLAEAIERSGLARELPGFDPRRAAVGVFGERAGPDTVLRDGDRVEIYRPLLDDPKAIRRRRALRTRRARRRSPG